jgi:hypothetical protein
VAVQVGVDVFGGGNFGHDASLICLCGKK